MCRAAPLVVALVVAQQREAVGKSLVRRQVGQPASSEAASPELFEVRMSPVVRCVSDIFKMSGPSRIVSKCGCFDKCTRFCKQKGTKKQQHKHCEVACNYMYRVHTCVTTSIGKFAKTTSVDQCEHKCARACLDHSLPCRHHCSNILKPAALPELPVPQKSTDEA
eukprot:CAMPEP_0176203440 /NCGR_PEP_ID=MMETSP0121_2-20121125/10583_1 /TAXON_ID=160619 /ORGANISM="Kryptoperidinium foliaceum, Strain CCMP 1326" /LENGTH=164 /DNA_ID=CAMNT_0017542349 /DNA_START=150 /DNA_END=644 /DNA_ORIENTATION=+